MIPITIELQDPETLLFDTRSELFVRLEGVPIVFTLRGLRHFNPRFRMVGIDIAGLRSEDQFRAAWRQWSRHETTLLIESIEGKARSSHQANEHQVLLAALRGDIDAAEAAMNRLAHRRRAALTLVRSGERP